MQLQKLREIRSRGKELNRLDSKIIKLVKVEADQIKRKGAEQVELQFFLNPNSEKSRSKPYALCTDVHSMLLFRKLSNL